MFENKRIRESLMCVRDQVILNKMKAVVESAGVNHQAQVERFLSLANKELHDNSDDVWYVAGASLGIKQMFVEKFGIFAPRSKAIYN